MTKKPRPAEAPAETPDALASAVDRLATEMAALRQVIDEVREDFSWLTRNGLPVQPIEHVHVTRMALDPCADDWGERLEIERSVYHPRPSASPLDSDALDRIVEDLKVTFEAAAQGQLEVVLTALDGVRGEIVGLLRRRRGDPVEPVGPVAPPQSALPETPTAPAPPAEDPARRPPPGRLF
jgi:hypothetical protein